MLPFVKYPRTPHLVGSRLQFGDASTGQASIESLQAETFIVEEKLDGANAALSFDADDRLVLQSRGHVLAGGAREAQFALFKAWATRHETAFRAVLGRRFIVFGEWCYAKHTCFYDALPHYFLEFDVFDRERAAFLSTAARRRLLAGTPLTPVPVIHPGRPSGLKELQALIRPSLYKSAVWAASLVEAALLAGASPERAVRETDPSSFAEGLYLKLEEGDRVIGRYKFIRADFLQAITDSGTHWAERPIIPNGLAPGVDIFAGA